MPAIEITTGIAAGIATAAVYFLLLKPQVNAATSGRGAALTIVCYYGRLIAVGLAVGGMLFWSHAAGLACAGAFLAARQGTIIYLRRTTPDHG